MTVLVDDCPACGLTTRTPLDAVRLVGSDTDDVIAYECDDCGIVNRRVPFSMVVWLVGRKGLPAPLTDEDIIGFQIQMVARGPNLSAVAALENGEVAR